MPATDVASQAGRELGQTMVMLGAYAKVTEVVSVESLVAGMTESLPEYRRQHAAGNAEMIHAGYDLHDLRRVPFWDTSVAGSVAGASGERPHAWHRRDRGRPVQGLRVVHPRLSAQVLSMSDDFNQLGFHVPVLHPGCTGCQACQAICPDWVFTVFRYEEPIELDDTMHRERNRERTA